VDTLDSGANQSAPPIKVTPVSTNILDEFFNALANEEGLGEVASRLRKVIAQDNVFAEPAIRAALFPDAP